jgi:glycosyltransferase involved in cell wall biosynthesis
VSATVVEPTRDGPSPDVRGLRVLEFCDYYAPGTGGGAERVAREVNRALIEMGARITVVGACPDAPFADPGIDAVARRAVDLTPLIGAQLSISPGFSRYATTVIRRTRPDVLYAHSIHFHGSLAAAVASRRTGIPLVTVVHVGGLDALEGRARLLAELHERTVGRFVLRSSAAVVAVAPEVATHARRRGARGEVTVAPNGVAHAAFAPAPLPDTPPDAPRVALPVVLFVGRLVDNKGIGLLLDAARVLWSSGRRFRVVVVGDGARRAALTAQCHAAGEPVEFTGHSDQVAALMRGAAVVVRPSYTEGMPLAVLEAMATRRCLVVSDIPAHSALLEHGVSGMLHRVGDVADLAVQLGAVLDDGALRERLAAAAHTRSLAHTWEACARVHASVLARTALRRA